MLLSLPVTLVVIQRQLPSQQEVMVGWETVKQRQYGLPPFPTGSKHMLLSETEGEANAPFDSHSGRYRHLHYSIIFTIFASPILDPSNSSFLVLFAALDNLGFPI
jgi:hypothetical protein